MQAYFSAERCAELHAEACAAYKAAKAELDQTPWWRVLKRIELRAVFDYKLMQAVTLGNCVVIVCNEPRGLSASEGSTKPDK